MLDDNPFLERTAEEAAREEFGIETADAPVPRDDDFATVPLANGADAPTSVIRIERRRFRRRRCARRKPGRPRARSTWCPTTANGGGDAPAPRQQPGRRRARRCHRAGAKPGVAAVLPASPGAEPAAGPRPTAPRLRFLIDRSTTTAISRNRCRPWPPVWPAMTTTSSTNWCNRFQMALGLLQSLRAGRRGCTRPGRMPRHSRSVHWRARDETEDEAQVRKVALAICKLPMDLLARRDFKRLATLTSQAMRTWYAGACN